MLTDQEASAQESLHVFHVLWKKRKRAIKAQNALMLDLREEIEVEIIMKIKKLLVSVACSICTSLIFQFYRVIQVFSKCVSVFLWH